MQKEPIAPRSESKERRTMALSDEKFLNTAPVAEKPKYDFSKALRGVGDPMVREAADFWLDFDGIPVKDQTKTAFSVGDTIEFTTPDGVKRVGSLARPLADSEWLVQTDESTYSRVPQAELFTSESTPAHAHREKLRAAVKKVGGWQERRKPQALSDGTIALTLDVGHAPVSDDDVFAYAASKGYKALDAAREGSLLRIIAQSETNKNMPGLEAEEMPGTGMNRPIFMAPSSQKAIEDEFDDTTLDLDVTPEQLMQLLERDASLAGFELGALVEDEHKISRSFQVPHKYLRPDGKVTAELSDSVVPVSGIIEREIVTGRTRLHLHTANQVEAPYAQGDGPLGTQKEAPRDQYVVRADAEVEAADKKTKKYYKDYFGEYGKMLTRDLPTKSHKSKSKSKPKSKKQAQMVTAKTIVNTLVEASESNPDLMAQLGKIVAALIAKNPKSILDQFDPTIFPRMIFGALSGDQNRKVIRLYREMVPAEQKGKPDFGKPETFAKQPQSQPAAPAQPAATAPKPAQPATTAPKPAQPVAPSAPRPKPVASADDDEPVVILPQFRKKKDKPSVWAPRKEAAMPLAFGDQARPRLDRITSQGKYLCIKMVWDPEQCDGMTDAGTKHNIISWLKGLATLKEEYPNLGFLGKPRFKSFDPDAGLAEIMVRSSEGNSFPIETHEVEATDNETRS